MDNHLTPADLARFTGSETFYRHMLNRRCVYTEGVQFLAENAGCYWLVDEIILVQPYEAALQRHEYQAWRLVVHDDRSATLTCTDGNDVVLYTKRIVWTDFPLTELDLWLHHGTLMLPSEY